LKRPGGPGLRGSELGDGAGEERVRVGARPAVEGLLAEVDDGEEDDEMERKRNLDLRRTPQGCGCPRWGSSNIGVAWAAGPRPVVSPRGFLA